MIHRAKDISRRNILGVVGAAAVSAVALTFFAKALYTKAGLGTSEFFAKLGEVTLQLAVIVIVGALIKATVDWSANQRRFRQEALQTCLDFMRRVRSINVTIQTARNLLNAHKSPRTWSEQSRLLMSLGSEVEEICEDLKASGDLFSGEKVIRDGLEEIVKYLEHGRQEYVANHDHVASSVRHEKNLQEIVDSHGMTWVKDLMSGEASYREQYLANLLKAKGRMRQEIFGG